MKKLYVKEYTKLKDGRELIDYYECESISSCKKDGWESIRLDTVNTVKGAKRKELKRGKYIVVEKLPHWEKFEVVVFENGTDNIVIKFNS